MSSIPEIWIKLVSTNSKVKLKTTIDGKILGRICLNNKLITINNILSKHSYSCLVSDIAEDPTAKTYFVWKFSSNIHLTSIKNISIFDAHAHA